MLRALCLLLASSAFAQNLPHKVDPAWPVLPEGSSFLETAGVAVDAAQNVYVFHRGLHPILKFDPKGSFVTSFGDGVFVHPHSIRIDREGNLWAVDDGGNTVVKLDAKGRVRMVLGRRGAGSEEPDRFDRPTDIAFAANGDIYVSDGYGNSRVVKYTRDGKFVKAWGKKGTGDGEFNIPHTVVVDPRGRVLVGDRENRRVQVFDADGRLLEQWKDAGSPWGLCLSPDGHVYMADGYNNRISKLTLDGKVVGTFAGPGKLPGELNFAHMIAVDKLENIYVAEILNWRAQKFQK